ncbi:MAG TPA: HEAT repeat domain-containing protein, partial [Blastocatellia bacterium]|nr:HEAT repeat domain-containing protein [Blastocatellia bacterium]
MPRKALAALFSLAILFSFSRAGADTQGFITVQGPTLESRLDSAVQLANSSAPGKAFWIAYAFHVREGVSVDTCGNDVERSVTFTDRGGNSKDPFTETRNLAVFLKYPGKGAPAETLRVLNLDRHHNFSGVPVYWLELQPNDASLNFLTGLVKSKPRIEVEEGAIMAVGLHDDQRIGAILEGFAGRSQDERARETAVFWLGEISGEVPFLQNLALDEREATELRKKAIFSIGIDKDSVAVQALEAIYGSTRNREILKQTVFSLYLKKDSQQAIDRLIEVAEKEADVEVRKSAIFWIGQIAGERTLGVLTDTVNGSDDDTEVKKAAVFAISQRPAGESTPVLIGIAKTHPNPRV